MTNIFLQKISHPYLESTFTLTTQSSALIFLLLAFLFVGYMVSIEYKSWKLQRKQGKNQASKMRAASKQTEKRYQYTPLLAQG